VEDVGITLGQALAEALGDKRGIRRYGAFTLVMDEARVDAALDLSARPFLVWDVDFPTPKIGTFDTELVREFFQALSTHGGITLHVTKQALASTATTSPRPRSRPSPAPCARRWSPTRAARMPSPRPRARSEAMTTVLVDYESGNLHSAEKAFQRMAAEVGAGPVVVTSDPDAVARADRVVLPGDGAFPACRRGLQSFDGLEEAVIEAVETRAVPFLGICVGMQMLADWGREYEDVAGFGWIGGEVVRITPDDPG
jgi:hypothetical protein